MGSLRVAFLTDYLATLAGTESSLVTACELLRRSGDQAVLFCYNSEGAVHPYWKSVLNDIGVRVIESPTATQRDGVTAESFCLTIADYLSRWRPHVIHSIPMGSLGLTWAMMGLLPAVPAVGTETSEASSRCFWYSRETFTHFNKYRAIIAPCEKVCDGVRSFFGYRGEIAVIPHLVPIPPEEIRPLSLSDLANVYSLGSISRLRVEKGPEFMVAALAIMAEADPRITLTIYGETQELERTRQIACALGIEERLFIPGPFHGRSEINRVISGHCIFLLSSLFESLPIALLEISARGRVTVASKVGGVPELFSSLRNGVLVPPGNPQAMAEAVLALLQNPRELIDRGREGVNRFRERYHVDLAFPALRQLYLKLAGFDATSGVPELP